MRSGTCGQRAALAALALLPAFAPPSDPPPLVAPPISPIEQRLSEAWRWRIIDGPDGNSSTGFRLVRAGRGGDTLLTLDDSGVASYDGWNWHQPDFWKSLTDEDLIDMAPLEDGLLLLGSHSVWSVNPHGVMKPLAPSVNPGLVSRPSLQPDGQVTLACNGLIEHASIELLEPLLDSPPAARWVTALTHDAKGVMWCVTEHAIWRRENEGWFEVGKLGAAPGHDIVYPLALSVGERMLFLPSRIDSQAPCVAWDGKALSNTHPPGPSANVTDAVVMPEGAAIVATSAPDLTVWRDGVWHTAPVPLFSALDDAVSLAALGEDRLAVVFASGRLAICDLGSHQWEAWDTRSAGVGNNVNAIVPCKRGGVWVATDEGVIRFDGKSFAEKYVVALDQPLHDITGLCEDDNGDLWVGSGNAFKGAWVLHDGHWIRHAEEDGLGAGYVHVIRKLDDEVWFTLLGGPYQDWNEGGLVRWKDGNPTAWLRDADGKRFPRTYDVVRRKDGTLVAGVRETLCVFDGTQWRSDPEALYNHTVYALHETEDGSLWAGFGRTNPKLGVMRNGPWTILGEGKGQDEWKHAAAASFAETPDHKLWFASEKGLFLVTGDTCHEVSGLLPIRKFWPLLPDAEQGGLWLGTMGGGLVHFTPADDDAPHMLGVTLRFGENGETIASWTAVDRWNATPPEELSFNISVDGEHVKGGANGVLQHSFSDPPLAPGPHTLRISALDNLGNEHGDALVHDFTVPPPAWRSKPVMLEASATVLALVWLMVVLRNRRRERAAAAAAQAELAERLSQLSLRLLSSQEDERRSLSREMHDDLGQLLTAACLDIERAARLEDPDRRQEALRSGLRAARDTQRRVREISHMLRPSELDDHGLPQAVATVLSDFTSRSGIDIDSRVDIEVDKVPADVANSVFRILQEALTNILRHARATTAYVTLRATEAGVELTVRDDGAGFAPSELPAPKHYGLLGMRERSELLGGKFSISSRPGAGTEVFVSIPIPHR